MRVDILISKNTQEHQAEFALRFSRCRDSLYLIAFRILDSPEEAEEAVQNCLLTASCQAPRFERDGAFGSWLLRVLIVDALIIRQQKKCRSILSEQDLSEAR